jgi:hypothetical protein
MPGSGRVAEPGLVGVAPGKGEIMIDAGLGLPPGVDDRAAVAADRPPVPHPGLGVDRLADRAEQAQRRQIVARRVLVAPPHEGANRGRRGVEDRHAPARDHVPEAPGRRLVGRALVQHTVAPFMSGP